MGGRSADRAGGPRRVDRRRRTRALAVLATAGTLAAAPAAAVAATDVEAAAAATALSQAALVPSGWTGSTLRCEAGTESQASLDATLQAVNAFRSVAGLTPVALDPALSSKALAAALMMRAGNEASPQRGLSHSPDPTWPCYSPLGADGAGTSNLALGSSGANAIRLYIDDEGVSSLGHRRWILDPALTTIGTGSTGNTNALAVVGGARQPVTPGRQVAWPPAGAIAATWLPLTWSLSLGGSGEAVSFTAPTVTMTLDGAPVDVPAATVADLGGGFGTGRTLSWLPTLSRSALRSGSHQVTVSIGGASINGTPTPIQYTVSLGPPPPTPTPIPTPAPTPQPPGLSTALANLQPRILRPRGRMRVGSRLTATFAQNTGRITTRMQWLRSGLPIRGATSIHHRITRKDLGRTLRIRVTSQGRDGSAQSTETSSGVKIRR